MINKKNIWFLTLFSLILVLSIYYLSMPDDIMQTIKENNNTKEEETVDIKESDALAALRIEADEKEEEEMKTYQEVLLNEEASVDDKNKAYESLKNINQNKGKEENIEKLIKENLKLNSFVKIKNDQVQVVISNKDHDEQIANKIIRTVQENFDNQMFITVKFQS